MIEVTVGHFDVTTEERIKEAKSICKRHAAAKTDVDIKYHEQTFRMTDCYWSTKNKILSGTMWRVRNRNLPSAWRNGKARRITSELAEGSSFAYKPSKNLVVIQYNHHGPRHKLLSLFLEQIGIKAPILITPSLDQKAIERLNHAKIVGRFEYSLAPMEQAVLRGAGLESALDTMSDVGGHSIRVSISLGRLHRGGSLKVKPLVKNLLQVIDQGVNTLKAHVKMDDDSDVEMLDLIRARLVKKVNANEVGMQIDHRDCRTKLRDVLA